MFSRLIHLLNHYSHSQLYWVLNFIAALSLLLVALVFQYDLGHEPCLICIQIRLWVSLWLLISLFGWVITPNSLTGFLTHASVVLIAVGLVERSYQLLGTERGFVFGDCGFMLGLPEWFAIEEWIPWLFRVETPCGYTPELLFGITMAEALMVLSSFLLLSSFFVLVGFLTKSRG